MNLNFGLLLTLSNSGSLNGIKLVLNLQCFTRDQGSVTISIAAFCEKVCSPQFRTLKRRPLTAARVDEEVLSVRTSERGHWSRVLTRD